MTRGVTEDHVEQATLEWLAALDWKPSPPARLCPLPAQPGGGTTWYSLPAPDAERALFFYARDSFGGANNWDVEVAFVADDGSWDSLFGANYRFTFNR